MKKLIEKVVITLVTLSVLGVAFLGLVFAAGLAASSLWQVFLYGWHLAQ